MTGQVGLTVAWPFWLGALALTLAVRWQRARNAGHLPPGLRHTWVMGLAFVLVRALFVFPSFLTGQWFLGLVGFIVLGRLWGSWDLLCEDLRHHQQDGRGLFEHEEDCLMVGGHRDTFIEKWRPQ